MRELCKKVPVPFPVPTFTYDLVTFVQLPNVGVEGSAVGIGLLVEGVAVGVVPLLEGVGHQADVLLALLLRRDCTLVDHIRGQAASLQNTAGWAAPTVAT